MKATEIATKLKEHVERVTPGQPFALTSAHQPGEAVFQGDLGIEIVTHVPSDYVEIKRKTDVDRQLVPLGGGPGSNHRLKHFKGVKLYRPKDWGKSAADLRGPVVVFSQPNEIVHEPGHGHPHGTVVIEAPMTVRCRYQRNLTVEERVVRAQD